MSLYNMVHGVNLATYLILPMLGRHPDAYPRFRDCFVEADGDPATTGRIVVYTRTGDACHDEDNRTMTGMPTFAEKRLDPEDTTYASFLFEVPEPWRADFAAILHGDPQAVSDAYVAEAERVYPKIADKLREVFRPGPPAAR